MEQMAEKDYSTSSSLIESIFERFGEPRPGYPPENVIRQAVDLTGAVDSPREAFGLFLFCVLAGDANVRSLIERLEQAPVNMSSPADLSEKTVGSRASVEGVQKHLVRLVNLASKARRSGEQAPLLAARYHFFVRSLEGISVKMLDRDEDGKLEIKPRLLLGRQRKLQGDPDGKSVAFELRACGRCGQTFLHGHTTDDGRFVSYYQRTRLEETPKKSEFLSIDLEQIVESAEDEIPLRDEKPPASEDESEERPKKKTKKKARTLLGDPEYMCPRCGFISRDNLHSCEYCRRKKTRSSRTNGSRSEGCSRKAEAS